MKVIIRAIHPLDSHSHRRELIGKIYIIRDKWVSYGLKFPWMYTTGTIDGEEWIFLGIQYTKIRD